MGIEELSFSEAIQKEEIRLLGEKEKLISNNNYYSFNHQHFSYKSRGIYIDQLKILFDLFKKEQIKIIKSEDLYTNPEYTLKIICKFLHISDFALTKYQKFNSLEYPKMDQTTRYELVRFFDKYNEDLYSYLGMDFDWH
jgi:hypothetical protein